MTGRLIVFMDPPDATVRVRHDTGGIFVGVPTEILGRPAQVVTIGDVPNGWGAWIDFARDGYELKSQHGVLWLDRHNTVTGSIVFEADTFAMVKQNPKKPLARLQVDGQCFTLATGERWTAIESTDFQLLQRVLAGEDIGPVLAQRARVGFNLLRVLGMCHQMFHLYPQEHGDAYFQGVMTLLQAANAAGLRVEFTAFADAAVVMPAIADQMFFWARLCDLLRAFPNVLLEAVNEADQVINRLDALASLPRPVGVLASHGSNGSEQPPVQPPWDYQTFHTNDAFEWQRKVGHNAMELGGCVLSNENTRFTDKAALPTLAFDAAAGAALLCAGSCFHSVSGKASVLWSVFELECAHAWVNGATSVPLEFQAGAYLHRADLEQPEDLRVYERRLGDGRGFVVHIRR